MQKFAYLLLTLTTLFFAEKLLAQEIEYPSNKPILSALSDNQVPGYYREIEKNGIGFSNFIFSLVYDDFLESSTSILHPYLFYDRTVSSSFKIHFFFLQYQGGRTPFKPTYANKAYKISNPTLVGRSDYRGDCVSSVVHQYLDQPAAVSRTCSIPNYITDYTMFGLSLRHFPIYKSGFFWGVGGGPIDYHQHTDNNKFITDDERIISPSPIHFRGIQYFIDLGWQGYNGFYFTINTRTGGTIIIDEYDEPNNEHWQFTAKGEKWWKGPYEAFKNPRTLMFGFGWHL